ncbi:MAG: hypothetical protein R3F19_23880 [Verrucomicrobiales bacterium]
MESNQNETTTGQPNESPANAATIDQLLIALTRANDRIQQLEDTIASLQAELHQSNAANASQRSKIDLGWLSMA